jgi:hypothetical protein
MGLKVITKLKTFNQWVYGSLPQIVTISEATTAEMKMISLLSTFLWRGSLGFDVLKYNSVKFDLNFPKAIMLGK